MMKYTQKFLKEYSALCKGNGIPENLYCFTLVQFCGLFHKVLSSRRMSSVLMQ